MNFTVYVSNVNAFCISFYVDILYIFKYFYIDFI